MIVENTDTGELLRVGGLPADEEKARSMMLDRFLNRLRKRARAWEAGLRDVDWEKYRVIRVTLTYAPGERWEKGHISEYRKAVQGILGEDMIAYFWWAQLQVKRTEGEKIHYHMMVVLRKFARLPTPDKSGMWKYGMSMVETFKDAGTSYAWSSYSGKREQYEGEFPRGMHKFEVWIREGGVREIDYVIFRLSVYPEWLADKAFALMGSVSYVRGLLPKWDAWNEVWWVGRRYVRSPWVWFSSLDHIYPEAKRV